MAGARLAFHELRPSHVLVTDADGFFWKRVRAADLLAASSAAVWFADHRGAAAGGASGGASASVATAAAERPPRPDTNMRARQFCSLHPWVASERSVVWGEHAARMAIGRDWAAWEAATAAFLPAPDAVR